MLGIVELHSLEVDFDGAIRSILSQNNYFNFSILGNSLDGLALLKVDLSWLVIINNRHSGLSVISNKFFVAIGGIKLDEEILIWLPVVVVIDLDRDELGLLAILEVEHLVKLFKIISSLCFSIDGSSSDLAGLLLLVKNHNLNVS